MKFFNKLSHSFELIKFSHSIFALPFALAAYLIASRGHVSLAQVAWVIFCVVCARTAAMAFNRLADAKIDAINPRTQNRHLPAGLLSQNFVIGLVVVFSLLFFLGALQLNPLAAQLAPLALGVLFFYSFTKRFTHFTQFFLGLALGIAPIAAYVAATGRIVPISLLLGLSVLCWVAGFDLLYALQDLNFDRQQGLYSLPVKLGIQKTFLTAKLLHLVFIILLFIYGKSVGLGGLYFTGLLIMAACLTYEHFILKTDLKKINAAFFTANGLLSLIFLFFVALDLYL